MSGSSPWLEEAKASIAEAHAAGRMPHAVLIQAAAGIGGDSLATWTAQLVLCTARRPDSLAARSRSGQPGGGGGPCGECVSCRRVAEGQHPDLTAVRLGEDSQQIRIEQIRELCAELALTSHQGGYKVAIIDPADVLNRFAANALLKTLEEPPPRTVLVLVAAQPSRLPATLTSRCQRIRVRRPTRGESLAWLEGTRGPGDWNDVLDLIGEAPVAAASLDPAAVGTLRAEALRTLGEIRAGAADPVQTAESWSRSELPLRLLCLENWLTECIRRGLGASAHAPELRATTHSPSADSVINTRALFRLLDEVRELKVALAAPINRSLALESLLRSMQA